MSQKLNYQATQTATKFHLDNSGVKLLIGCVGCGKSVTSCIEIFIRASQQAPGRDGIRRSRWAIVRNTYPELKATTIKTWTAWFPEEVFGKIKYDSPITQHIRYNDIDLEIIFLALDKPKDVKKLKSLELTGAYINELQFIDEDLFLVCKQRTNRYPSKKEGAKASWTGVIADANPPSTHHWMYETFSKNPPIGYKTFYYEPAVIKVEDQSSLDFNIKRSVSKDGTVYISNPNADFIDVQNDPEYWIKLIPGLYDESIKVDHMGQYGVVISGRAVHETYNDSLHYANRSLDYDPNIELGLGWDFGNTPACSIVQLTPRGRLESIDELWSVHMGIRDFASNIVIPHLDRNYKGWRDKHISVHDPAGESGVQTDLESCGDVLRELGIKSEPAQCKNNDMQMRRDGLKYFLSKMVDGRPAYSVSSKCSMIREGLMGHFQYGRIQSGGDSRYHEKPLKNIYSHICEAHEYIAGHYSSENKKPLPSTLKPNIIKKGSFMTF